MSELKPCPFCGAAPDTFPKNPKMEGDAWAAVRCVNSTCESNPELKLYEDSRYNDGDEHGRWLDGDEILKETIKAWNTRADDKRIEGVWETIRNWEDSFAPDPLPYEVAEFVSDLKEELEK